ncbi:unnamed protein product, partial [Didymodactylos carnosus]
AVLNADQEKHLCEGLNPFEAELHLFLKRLFQCKIDDAMRQAQSQLKNTLKRQYNQLGPVSNCSRFSVEYLQNLQATCQQARTMNVHPGYLILPCSLSISLAFVLPISSNPNAIVFASGSLRVWDMIKVGLIVKILGFFVAFLAATTWMTPIYKLNQEFVFNKTADNM